MSNKTKIVVLHLKELIYTAIFAGLGVLLVVLLCWMFVGKEKAEVTEETLYVPGVYSASFQMNDNAIEVQVIVDENHINDIAFNNLEESVSAMYPLMEPAMESIKQQVYEKQSLDDITYESNNQYTTEILVMAVQEAIEQARVTKTPQQ